jgi:hypothetical protein
MPGYVSRESADRWNRTAQIVAGGGAGSFTSPVPFADSGAEPLLFKNVSGETIPPFACVQLTGTTESGTHTNLLNADQPADAHGHSGPYAFNGPSSVAAGEIGTLQSGPAYRGIYNSGTQTAGIKYHPIKNSWEIKGAGFGTGSGIWSYVGTDDIIADTIRVKSCAAGETVCPELGDLAPGTYRGISGATTAPGETGPVIVTGCNGEVTIDAVNHSGCTFYLGDRISVHIDPCCVAHFDGCSAGEPTACESSVYVCVGGDPQILAADGGTYTWDMSTCCDCASAELDITLSCTGTTIEADWEYRCGGNTDSGTIDISGVFNLSADVYQTEELAIVNADCEVFSVAVDIQVVFSNVATDCATCLPICCECAGPAVKGSVFGPEFQTFPSFICEGVQYTFTMNNHNTNCTSWPNSVITFESGSVCCVPTIHSHNFGDITTDVNGRAVPRWRCAVDGTPPSTFTVVASFTRPAGACQSNCFEVSPTFKDDLDPTDPLISPQSNTIIYEDIPCEEGGGPGGEGGGV